MKSFQLPHILTPYAKAESQQMIADDAKAKGNNYYMLQMMRTSTKYKVKTYMYTLQMMQTPILTTTLANSPSWRGHAFNTIRINLIS